MNICSYSYCVLATCSEEEEEEERKSKVGRRERGEEGKRGKEEEREGRSKVGRRERGEEGKRGKEEEREGRRERGREGGREGGKEEEREGRRKRGREGGREGGKEEEREGKRERGKRGRGRREFRSWSLREKEEQCLPLVVQVPCLIPYMVCFVLQTREVGVQGDHYPELAGGGSDERGQGGCD